MDLQKDLKWDFVSTYDDRLGCYETHIAKYMHLEFVVTENTCTGEFLVSIKDKTNGFTIENSCYDKSVAYDIHDAKRKAIELYCNFYNAYKDK